jgi:hypothetical protein
VISAVIAAIVVIAIATQGVRGLRLSVAAMLVGSAGLAILSARRADWDWKLGARLFLNLCHHDGCPIPGCPCVWSGMMRRRSNVALKLTAAVMESRRCAAHYQMRPQLSLGR